MLKVRIAVLSFLLLTLLPVIGFAVTAPVGISSYSPTVTTTSILGYANISSLLAYNSTFFQPYGASLQLNAILEVDTPSNTYYFWVQNVAGFITSNNTLFFNDNIWNATGMDSNITEVIGDGNISTCDSCQAPQTFYGASSQQTIYYHFPLSFYMFINVTPTVRGPLVTFGYVILQNGKITSPKVQVYDNAIIPVQGAISAQIVVQNSYTYVYNQGLYSYYGLKKDVELVWGGLSNGEHTTFKEMSSLLAIYYLRNGQWLSFNEIYNYGFDTAESANNLTVYVDKQGFAHVITGNLYKGELTSDFNPPKPYFTFINISSKVPFIINGNQLYNFTGYINSPISVYFYSNYSLSNNSFALLNYSSNQKTVRLVINSSTWFDSLQFTPNYTFYYRLNVISSIPARALINGVNTTLKSGWYAGNTRIIVLTTNYYLSNNTRYVITRVEPSTSIVVNRPLNLTVKAQLQYLVNISGILTWENNGSEITIPNYKPLLYTMVYEGTYNLLPGDTITVTQPISERLIIRLNYVNILIVSIGIITLLTIYLVIRKPSN
ncbi:thermopsin family protease [Sulfolobus acidocaldarius]|uniref:Thermopsin n=4 Tax=Sulfolobus acidocaldarius TaxID=2285 RepID=Q4J6X2_SULAC|nr:thermopsin family protease [Sulfolobus acidocaldarius]AAY81460.1 thermopsin [Sulfolobus acidocaldarius DSM 639]AGE72062.1 thermopsin [Sulfolobus acidocaldarius N8]AGE74379.1 thermopsin [Sulfolobus acidocaldarius Ron12/I]ALU29752.1 thermopsin [Sulfolobus acidocaldarius]ALU32489.1 thermopsin [Sulfolobus acidocaldarius]